MPNWCLTRITINHDNELKLKELKKLINKWTENNYKENDFGLCWLGNIVGNSGIGTVDENPKTDLKCRGMLDYMEFYNGQLLIDVETAWVPMFKMWTKLLEKYLPDAELIYSAEEYGNGLYCTNDPRLKNCYIIDVWDMDDIESDWEASESYVRKTLQKLLNTNKTDVDELLAMFRCSAYSDNMSINKWSSNDIDTWD